MKKTVSIDPEPVCLQSFSAVLYHIFTVTLINGERLGMGIHIVQFPGKIIFSFKQCFSFLDSCTNVVNLLPSHRKLTRNW